MFWLISEAFYPLLRSLEGCDSLLDLKATLTDNDHINLMADNLGIPEENRFINISPSFDDLKKANLEILRRSRKFSSDGVPHVIFVYVGGHGATDNEKQIFLLNAEESKKAMFNIEYKLRTIVADELSMARIFAVYDCCRVALKNFPGLVAGRGSGDVDGESMEENENEPNKYFHIQACGPGGIADADGGFAERLSKIC